MSNSTAARAALPAARTALGSLLACVLLCGCASQPIRDKDPRDPWERMNRPLWNLDVTLAKKVAIPLAHGYTRVVPQFMRTGIANFMDNSFYPEVIVNDLLQGKLKFSLIDTGRFLMNSTAGIGGLLDPAGHVGLPKRDNDFGRTLGTWGVPPGPYLVIPLVGPSDVRDLVSRVPDGYLWGINYIPNDYALYSIYFVYLLDTDARTLVPAFDLLESQHVFDQYGFARNAFLQRREFLIHGQSTKSLQKQEEELEKSLQDSDDSGPGGTPGTPGAPGAPGASGSSGAAPKSGAAGRSSSSSSDSSSASSSSAAR